MNKTAKQLERVADALAAGDTARAAKLAKSKFIHTDDDSVGTQQVHQLAECIDYPVEQGAALFRALAEDPMVNLIGMLTSTTLAHHMERHLGCPKGIGDHFGEGLAARQADKNRRALSKERGE